MATAFRSLASHGFPKRLRSDLPLIACDKCEQKIVREYRVKKKGPNQGRIFYTCQDRKVSNFLSYFIMVCSHFYDDFD
jgi:lysine/ornithine N-monooxygenase